MESVEPLAPQDPQQIGAYRLLGRLGSGGMGRVYLGRTAGGRTVAVKLVKPELAAEEEFRARFRTEVRAAARVGGEWTAPVLDADTEAPVPWVATGYVAGPTLQEVVERYGPLPPESLFTLAYGLASALRDVHAAGLVHRDLKPSNVLVTIEGPRVIDFGIARALDSLSDGTVTRTGIVVGSPSFMSPEQIIGEDVSAASDVFCVGGLLAYAATGRAPFGSSSSGMHAVMFRVVQEEPDLAGVTDPALHGLISGCLAKLPAERHGTEQLARLAGPPAPEAAWLPAPLIAELGRQAVRLLDTDTPPAGDRDTSPLRTVPPADQEPPTWGGAAPGAGAAGAGAGFAGAGFAGAGFAGAGPNGDVAAGEPADQERRVRGAEATDGAGVHATETDWAHGSAADRESGGQRRVSDAGTTNGAGSYAAGTAAAHGPTAGHAPGAGTGAAGGPTHAAPGAGAAAGRESGARHRAPDARMTDGAGSNSAGTAAAYGPTAGRAPGAERPGAGGGAAAASAGAWPRAAGSEDATARHTAAGAPAAVRGPGAEPRVSGRGGDGENSGSGPRLRTDPTRPYETSAAYGSATGPADDTPAAATAPPRRRPRRARLLAAVALLVAVGVAVPVALAALRDDDTAAASGSDVPARYLGTWHGTQLHDGEPTDTYRQFTIRPGRKGEVVATSIVLTGKSQCTSEGKLTSAGKALRFDTAVVEAAPAGECTAVGGHTLTYADGALRWRAADGRTAELTEVEARDRRVPRELLGRWQRPAGSGTQVMRVVQAAPGQAAVHFTTRTDDGNTCQARADFVGVDQRDDRVLLGPSEITSVAGPEDPADPEDPDDPAAGEGRLGGPCVPGYSSAVQATADGSVLDRQFLGGEQRTRHYTRADGSPADPTQ
ncbi:serine/threonine-protein kinase [Streptomyces sp. WMMC500]|uniref:serine/threonine-protein kinase n=1 Tax=Streptomyces sp. WMMC500 TaxID=3015154 RepID=UPI00248C8401|nr:serine/threonine-protein kinase [Streptomyces sp. WMMC500]WBB64281.1 serine/threonine-protein kinase [Streptomyces sp. WMMC500]